MLLAEADAWPIIWTTNEFYTGSLKGGLDVQEGRNSTEGDTVSGFHSHDSPMPNARLLGEILGRPPKSSTSSANLSSRNHLDTSNNWRILRL